MASGFYNLALAEIGKALIDLDGDTLKVMIVDSTYVYDPDHTVVDNGGNNATDPTDYWRASSTTATARVTNMQSRVVNIAGKKDFYIKQLDSDFASLGDWATSTIYVPTGNVDEILAASTSFGVMDRTQASTTVAGGQPLAVQTISGGLGELGQVYTSTRTGWLR